MGCRLPTIGRYRRERSYEKQTGDAKRRADREELSEKVADLRNRNVATLCRVAEFVNQSADETHAFLADRQSGRIEAKHAMRRELRAYREKVRADMERIVSTDF